MNDDGLNLFPFNLGWAIIGVESAIPAKHICILICKQIRQR